MKPFLNLPVLLIFLFWSLSCTVKGAANLSLFLLFISSIAFWKKMGNDSLRHWAILLALPFLFTLLQMLLGFDLKSNVLDAPSRFLLSGACIFMFYHLDCQKLARATVGVMLGAIGVGVWAYLSTHFDAFSWTIDPTRAWNGFSNPIHFGLLSVLLGMLSLNLPHALFPQISPKIFMGLKITAFASALFAAYFSLSRVALFVLPFLGGILIFQHARSSKKAFLGTVLAGVALTTLLFTVENPYQTRIKEGFAEIAAFDSNKIDQTSMGLRLRMWKEAFQIIEAHPVGGVGKMGFLKALQQKNLSPTDEMRKAPHPHSDYLNFGIEFGAPGLVLALLFYFVPLCFFLKHLKSPHFIIQHAASNGALVVSAFALGGIFDCYFWISSLCVFYGLSVALFVAMILKEQSTANVKFF